MLRPISIAEHVKQGYRSYMKTTFPVADEKLRGQIHEFLNEEGLLWRGPYLSLQRPYERTAMTLAEQKDALGLHEKLLSAGTGRVGAGAAASTAGEDVASHGHLGGARSTTAGSNAVPFGQWRLFTHQQTALEQILAGENTIVSSGTGSGKTEAFFFPILNYCLKKPGPGIKALILYPMNALANDQYQRFAKYLAGTGVTFARYTGDTPEDEQSAVRDDKELRPKDLCPEALWYRKDIRDPATKPNILMTNYSMLEYLLLRKQDRILFDEDLRFLVLDEVHTYSGARGIEVACLIRRLKEHVGKLDGKLLCIGTSATVKGESTAPVAEFATELFGETFHPDRVTTEIYEQPAPPGELYVPAAPSIEQQELSDLHDVTDFDRVAEFCATHIASPEKVASVRARIEATEPPATPDADTSEEFHARTWKLSEFLGALLSQNALLRAIEEQLLEPRSLDDVAAALRDSSLRRGADETFLRREIEAYLLLGARARVEGQPLIRPKVHVFWRGLQGMYRCTNPECGRLYREFMDTCSVCRSECLPVDVCRQCGQDFYHGYSADLGSEEGLKDFVKHKGIKRKKYAALPSSLVLIDEPRGEQVPVRITQELRDETNEEAAGAEDAVVTSEEAEHNQEIEGARYCPHCATVIMSGTGACACGANGARPMRTYIGKMHKCPACSGQYGVGLEVVTSLRSATMISINILVEGIFQNLTSSQRRMLVFCDNRQDTAFQAAHLNNKHGQFVGRQLIYEALSLEQRDGAESVSFEKLVQKVYELRRCYEIFCPKETRDASGQTVYEVRAPQNPDETKQEYEDIQLGILAEIARPGSKRISLEGLGLLALDYVSADSNVKAAAAENTRLQRRLGLSAGELGEFLATILDEMRWRRALSHPALLVPLKGRHPFGITSLPVGFMEQGGAASGAGYQTVGFFSRSGGLTLLLNYAEKVTGKEQAKDALEAALDFLIEEAYIVRCDIGDAKHSQNVFMVNYSRLMLRVPERVYRCERCGFVAAHNARGRCPRWRCEGKLAGFEPQTAQNYYSETYRTREAFRMIAGEHSAQLSSKRRIEVERAFREKRSDVLVCTPTMEMGVDIGDLPTVLMRNVPPGPANYAQRSGRAGRRDRVALINTFALSRAHDTYFFDHPQEMIAGAIEPPKFTIENERILKRQINSLILEKLDFTFERTLGEMLLEDDTLNLTPLKEELTRRRSDIVTAVLQAFNKDRQEERKREQLAWITEASVGEVLDGYADQLTHALSYWLDERRRLEEMGFELAKEEMKIGARDPKRAKAIMQQRGVLLDLISQLDRQYPLSYLSERGFLPSYAFPSDSARLVAKEEAKQPLFRSAEVALVEYAPGNHVYMDGRRYQMLGLDFHRSAVPDLNHSYKRCPVCDVITTDQAASVCEHCGRELEEERPSLTPTSYVAERADAISADEEYRRRAYYKTRSYLLSDTASGDPNQIPGLLMHYHRHGQVLVVNEGLYDDGARGFRLCTECGFWQSPTSKKKFEDHKLLHNRRKTCGGRPKRFDFTHQFRTDVLVLRFEGAAGYIQSLRNRQLDAAATERRRHATDPVDAFYASLKAALIDAANTISHAEEREIGGFLRTIVRDQTEERDLILYDRVPGGAGYVRVVADRIGEVLRTARGLLDGCTCERSCYRCLRSYSNQFEHALLDKRTIMPFLDYLLAINDRRALAELERFGPGSRPYCGGTPSLWLQRKLQASGGQVLAVTERIDGEEIAGAEAWADFLAGHAKKHPETRLALGLREIPDLTTMSAGNFLAVKALMDLLEAGIEVYRIAGEAAPRTNWQLAWGAGGEEPIALANPDGLPELTPRLEQSRLFYHDDAQIATQAARDIEALLAGAERITPESLRLPDREGYRIEEIRDGDAAVSYEKLFRDELRGAPWVRIVDPYIRAEYQVRNLEEFANQVGLPPGGRVELVTMYPKDERYGLDEEARVRERLERLRDFWSGEDLHLAFSFDPTIHDRYIETDAWQIILGRGLDIFYPPEPGPGDRLIRKARRCTIVYLPKEA